MKASTRNRKLSALKTFFKYLARRGRVPFSPAADIEGAKQDKHLPKPINVEVLDQLFEAVNNLRDRTLLEILYGCGLRRMELVKIRISDIDFTQGFIRVLGKGGTERIVPIRGIALQITKELAAKASGEWLFEGGNGHLSARQANDIIAKWRGVVGAKWITPHKFRHSFATHLLNNGMELKYVQELLGHANPATTQIYTKVDNRRVANDYEQFHPRAKSAL
jgi:site-specific recombinase XerD